MRYPITRSATCLLAAVALATTGCGKKEAPKPAEPPAAVQPAPPPAPLAVASIDLGKSVDSAKKVAAGITTFGVKDTIYASVSTTGVGSDAAIGAKWSFVKKDGSLVPVNESSQTITTTGPSATEFHITKATAWPKGNYRVEVTLNGASAGTKDFTVQ
jgi:hypothetical protein